MEAVSELAGDRREHAYAAHAAREALQPRRRFENLLDRHEARLRRVAFGMLGDPDRVDDVLQDAFLKAYRRLPDQFDSHQAEATWLYRIVHRCCLDELRRRRRHPETPLHDVPAGDREQDASLAVAEALGKLPAEGRAVVLLVDLIGFDYDAAATIVGVPRGTIASRLNGARARLRELLA